MFKLEIDEAYWGHFETVGAAMVEVERWARPFHRRWVIVDGHGRVCAQG